MKFFFDNNLSPHLAHAIRELCVPDGATVKHLTDRFNRAEKDLVWIKELANEGDWAVISQDRFSKNDLEREALRSSGLIVFCLQHSWSSQQYWPKAQNLVRWWPAILEQASRIQGGAAFRVPWRFSGKGRFEQIKF